MNLKRKVWNEEYRPKKIIEVISPHTTAITKYLVDSSSIPNFLFYSKIGGTGKSSMARAIVKELDCDCLTMNASADRSIDSIRTKILDFARSKSTNGKRKCVFMDEMEKLSKDAMDALKNMIEEYTSNTFYIGTTNNIEKINQPMQSRFICLEFAQPEKSRIETFLKFICVKEDLIHDDNGIKKLVSLSYPSIRNMINKLQDLKMQDLTCVIENITQPDDKYRPLWELVTTKKFSELKTNIIEDNVNVEEFNRFIFDLCAKDEVDVKKQLKLLQILSRNEIAFSTSADKLIVFIASVIEMIMVMKE